MNHYKWVSALFAIAMVSGAASAIEGGGGDRDSSRGPTWDRETREMSQGRYDDRYYSDNETRARHQRYRYDDAERYSSDFDVQSRMND